MLDTHTHTHTHACPWSYIAMHKRTYTCSRSATITHTHTSSSLLEFWLMMTHPYPCPRLIACTNTYVFMFTGAFPLHAYGVTCNLCSYFTSVWRVFLVKTVVLHTVLWDIRAWSARFLGFYLSQPLPYWALLSNRLFRQPNNWRSASYVTCFAINVNLVWPCCFIHTCRSAMHAALVFYS